MFIFGQTQDSRLHDRKTSCGLFLFASVPSFDETLPLAVWTTWQFWILVALCIFVFSIKVVMEEGWGAKSLALFFTVIGFVVAFLINIQAIVAWSDEISTKWIREVFHI